MNEISERDDVNPTAAGSRRGRLPTLLRWPILGGLGASALYVGRFAWELASQRGRTIQGDPGFDGEAFLLFAATGSVLGLVCAVLRTTTARQWRARATNRWRRPADNAPRWAVPLVRGLLLVAAAAIGAGTIGLYRSHQLSRWRSAQATVLQSRIDTLEPNRAVVSVEYEFAVEGTTYQGRGTHQYEARRRDQWALQFARTFAENTLRQNAPGTSLTVFYDPRQPRTSQIGGPARDQVAPAALVNVGCAVLALSLWGLYFRRFVFGSAWIAVTLIIASALGGLPVYYTAEWTRTAHSDGAGFVMIGGMMVAIATFFATIVGSSIAYAVYWRRQFPLLSAASRYGSSSAAEEQYNFEPGGRHDKTS